MTTNLAETHTGNGKGTGNGAITGTSIIAGVETVGNAGTIHGVNPATGDELSPAFGLIDETQLAAATEAAAAAFDAYRKTTPEQRAAFLERIADNIESEAAELTERGTVETGLPAGRLTGERGRTVGQLRMFADVVRAGDHLGARIDPAQPDRAPAARPDIRQRHLALGPVAVFGASNFPLAFSTAGGDTASALAAGCPVIVKAHNAHPGTAELVGRAVTDAVEESGLPAGIFSMLFGRGTEIGQALVSDPRIKAVGFTGSRAGGTALMHTAATRPEPIPVYAEMSSTNPVAVLPGSLADDVTAVADGFISSLTLGSGQFCTNPGLVFVPTGANGDAFVSAAAERLRDTTGTTMLTGAIAASYDDGVERLGTTEGVHLVAVGSVGDTAHAPAPRLFATTAATFSSTADLQDEVFGSAALLVRYDGCAELLGLLEQLQGQLTATIRYAPPDAADAAAVLPVLERKVGRILFNSWPTGVEVTHAMVHGGPFPATSDSTTTSVGSLAIHRFQRPVSYQDVPDDLLPEPLRQANPWRLNRRIDGAVTEEQS